MDRRGYNLNRDFQFRFCLVVFFLCVFYLLERAQQMISELVSLCICGLEIKIFSYVSTIILLYICIFMYIIRSDQFITCTCTCSL